MWELWRWLKSGRAQGEGHVRGIATYAVSGASSLLTLFGRNEGKVDRTKVSRMYEM